MPWIQIRPSNSGGGRRPAEPTAKLYDSGQLTISHAACEMLGYPAKVLVEIEPEVQRIRLRPTTPENQGGFSLAGGGNSPHRLRATVLASQYPQMIGEYKAIRMAGGIELRKEQP